MPPEYLNICPFCNGNEHETPKEFLRVTEDGKWKMRVVSNKYPALLNKGERKWWGDDGKRSVSGVGIHEIIIESPHMASMDLRYIEEVISIYKKRYKKRFIEAHRDPGRACDNI